MGKRTGLYMIAMCLDEARMIPFFFRHYNDLIDRFIIYDNGSTDGSLELLAGDPRVVVKHFETVGDSFMVVAERIANESWKECKAEADWVVTAEMDEHLYHEDLLGYLSYCRMTRVTALAALGYNMVSDRFPQADGPLHNVVTRGERQQEFDKLCIFDPKEIVETNYNGGRHSAEPKGNLRFESQRQVRLLHYKYLGVDYVMDRNARLSQGLRSGDLTEGVGTHYFYDRARTEAMFDGLRMWARRVPGLRACGPTDLTFEEEIIFLEESGLFAEAYYLDRYADLRDLNSSPLRHFCTYGWREDRQPNPFFNTKWYRSHYAEALPADVNPLLEYAIVGEREGRCASAWFEPTLYRMEHKLGPKESALRHAVKRYGASVLAGRPVG